MDTTKFPHSRTFGEGDEVSINISSRGKTSSSSKSPRKASKSSRVSLGGDTSGNDTTLEDVDVEELGDEDLRAFLTKCGVEVGPIVESTRGFYKKKLTALLSGAGAEAVVNGSSNGGVKEFSDTEPEEEEEIPPVIEKRTTRYQTIFTTNPYTL